MHQIVLFRTPPFGGKLKLNTDAGFPIPHLRSNASVARVAPMNTTSAGTYTAITKQDDGWWIGWIEEVPGVNAQERTKEALLLSLRELLKEALEFNREDARASARGNYTEEPMTV